MLTLSSSFKTLDSSDLGDNLLYYDYQIKHLLSLIEKGLTPEDEAYISSYRSFEGEVFENYAYEMLLRHIKEFPQIKKFIAKGPHKKRTKAQPNSLSVNWKGQIVYRIKRNEIGEFDALFFTDNELYFVEMTLVSSVSSLRKRMRKKYALLKTLFPKYEIKALLILNRGVVGLSALPAYCTAWVTDEYSAKDMFKKLIDKDYRRKKFRRIQSEQIVDTDSLDLETFRYYNTLGWILNKIRTGSGILNIEFLCSKTVQRYHDLFVKIYVGYMEPVEFSKLFSSISNENNSRVYVALEKDHNGGALTHFYLPHSRKNLEIITLKNGKLHSAKKDPYGVTVTEISYIKNVVKQRHSINFLEAKKVLEIAESIKL